MFHIIWYIIIGFIAGALANFVMGVHHGSFIGTTILGIVGGLVGGLVVHLFSRPAEGTPFHPAGLIFSFLGAVLVLFIKNRLNLAI